VGRREGKTQRQERCEVTSRSKCIFQAVRQAVCVFRGQIATERRKAKTRKRICVLYKAAKKWRTCDILYPFFLRIWVVKE